MLFRKPIIVVAIFIVSVLLSCLGKYEKKSDTRDVVSEYRQESHRPQFHFSPETGWMNDPNGLVYYDGEYHLFYQYFPDSTVWGPMHWGHAVTRDLVHWEHLQIALYPDSLGYIFSGSAVADLKNTSGFGTPNNPPLVAIFTYHDPAGEKKGETDYQTQGIAYSLDNGRTWTKYENNPVLKNPGIRDFRDPKVFWHEETSRWIMILAVRDRVHFYSSDDLKNWHKESEFGADAGAHGGVWECPDLFPFTYDGMTKWVLLLNINPGGPNGGSATQYFIGEFDGRQFTVDHDDIRWLDYGPDEYAGVTWSNVKDRTLFLGWMSNWLYGQVVPTGKWRSAMTIPRELSLEKVGEDYFVSSMPIAEMDKLIVQKSVGEKINNFPNGMAKIVMKGISAKDFKVTLSNTLDEKLVLGYDNGEQRFYIDRSQSGKVGFQTDFKNTSYAPRISDADHIDLTLFIDHSSIEIFADDGLTVMTSIFFPSENFTRIDYEVGGDPEIKLDELRGIWSDESL